MSLNPKIANMPLLLSPDYAESFASGDLQRLEKKAASWNSSKNILPGITGNNIAVISVHGPLSQTLDFWSFIFGGSSYGQIRTDLETALEDEQIDTILFDINSPGGTVAGAFDLVDEIYEARSKKRIIAFINEMAYSAAYAIASAASEVYIPRTGGAGSIGVIAMHVDQSQFDKKLGVKYTPIFSGDKKNDFSGHEPLSVDAYETVKAEIDDVFNLFAETVARNRDVSTQEIKNMEAALFQGKKAVTAGLADEVRTYKQLLKGGLVMTLLEKVTNAFKDAKPEEIEQVMSGFGYILKVGMVSEEELRTQMETQATKLANEQTVASETARADGKLEGKEDAKKAAVSILELCAVAGDNDLALKMVSEGVAEEEARKQLIAAKSEESGSQTVISTVNPLNTGETNPLLADAERRAKEAN